MRKINFLFMLLVMTLVSCVGTIEDTSTPNIDTEGGKLKPAAYTGISGAKAISDTRVEIYFPPAPGNQENYLYQIYKDRAEQPIEIRYSALSQNYDGLLSYTYTELQPSTKYSFSVEFRDLIQNNTSRSTNGTINAETFSNQMCDFDGIVDARSANGLAALNTINVYWFPAKDSGFVVSSEDYDPVRYEIVGISEDDGGLERIEDINANRIIVAVDSSKSFHAVTGLQSGTKYFFQVRCKHKGWQNKGYIDFNETLIGTYRRETNTKYIEISTKASGKSPEFERPFEVINPLLPTDAESQLGVQWQPAVGGFSEYRIFYKKVSAPSAIDESIGLYDEDSMMETPESINDIWMDGIVTSSEGDGNPCVPKNSECGSIKVVAEEVSGTIEGLEKFAFYQVLVVACTDSLCDSENRINGKATQRFGTDYALARVIPNIIPFNGITSIDDPNPSIDSTMITLNFNSPLRDAGYATELVVRCLQGADDSSPVVFPEVSSIAVEDRNPITGTGKTECDNLSLRTVIPGHAGMLGFTQIKIDGVQVNSNRNYCFTVHPKINQVANSLRYFVDEEENAIIQCLTPRVAGPNLQEFAGRRTDICNFDDSDPNNLKLGVKWFEPSGGYWTNFRVFWKEFDPENEDSDLAGNLNFQKAIDGNTNYNSGVVSGFNKEYIIEGVEPGKKYHIGVLPFFELDSETYYGEFNTATSECAVPYPEVEFHEWTNIISIGPKVDGRIPETINQTTQAWSSTRFFESLDEYGMPVEVELQSDGITPNEAALRGNKIYNAIPGRDNANVLSGESHFYSNSGIIRIEFKDILVDHNGNEPSWYDPDLGDPENGRDTFHRFREYLIDNEPETYARNEEGWNDGVQDTEEAADKTKRKIGYKILRSDDNQQTWVDLTRKHPSNPFQTENNQGLVYSEPVTYFKINGRERVSDERRVVFTDYSVKHLVDRGVVSRGRVYWYKVIPVINGVELKYKEGSTNSHHMIRVVLPPPNMAFVSRKMVNRQACIELGKEDQILKEDGMYYACPYNGVGARGLEIPWSTTSTFYDVGGDLLVDRFELGCDWTRGDMSEGSPASSLPEDTASDENELFDIYKDFTEGSGINGESPMKGCFQLGHQKTGSDPYWNDDDEPTNDEPTNFSPAEGITLSHKKAIPGDCFGEGERRVYQSSNERCNYFLGNGTTPQGQSLVFPGAFRNFNDFLADGDPPTSCLSSMTSDFHNAHPSLPYTNSKLFEENLNPNGNMDPYQAHSEYAAVFYLRNKSGQRLNRHFSANDSANSEDRYLTSDRSIYHPGSCYINLYGKFTNGKASLVTNHETDVRPRWLSLRELIQPLHVRNIDGGSDPANESISGLYKETLGYIKNQNNTPLYGGDWSAPNVVLGIIENRMHDDLPLARIMTSNASKLPQLEGLNQSDYQKVCELYEVEIGYSDTSDNFVRTYPEPSRPTLKKRLARRAEFVAFSAWSDRLGEATVLSLEKGDSDTNLQDLIDALASPDSNETGTSIDPDSSTLSEDENNLLIRLKEWESSSCNTMEKHQDNSYRTSNFYSVDLNDTTADRFKDLQPTFPKRSTTDNPHYWSGSSQFDSTDYNSERCVSRYGIQDHIGNVREMGTDQFWCDELAHEFAITSGAFSLNLRDYDNPYFLISEFPDWDNQINNTGTPFGECSMRGPGNDFIGFNALDGSMMVSIYNDYTQSNLNTGLLKEVNTVDKEAILTVRNGGDGEFLAFGDAQLSPPLYMSTVNESGYTLKSPDYSEAGYFSPVLGLPIRCPGSVCDNSADNKLITSDIFHSNLASPDFGNVIASGSSCSNQLGEADFPITNCNFPFGNSDIESFSTHEYNESKITLCNSNNSCISQNSYSWLQENDFIVDADENGAVYAKTKYGDPDSDADGIVSLEEGDAWIDNIPPSDLEDDYALRLVRIFPRYGAVPGIFISGGGATSVNDKPGRYALDIDMDRDHTNKYYKNTARCVVKIFGRDY